MNELGEISKSIKMWGWLVLIAGVLSLLAPLASGIAISMLVGALLVVAGITRLFNAFQGAGLWSGLFGLISTIAGLTVMGRPLLGLATLTMVLMVYFLAIGFSEVIAAFQIRPVQGWGFLLFSGIISIVLGMMIWNQWPLSGRWAVGVLVGIQLMFSGMTMITLGSALKTRAA